MRPISQEPVDLVTFSEEILNGKLHFLCSVYTQNNRKRSKKSIMKGIETRPVR